MQFRVIVESEGDFAVWLRQQAEPARQPANSIYEAKKCGDCHANGKGPDLTHVGSRQFLGAGISRNTPANMALWVRRPQSIKPGNHMPDQQLSDDEVAALTAYFEGMR
jgi:cytochrome c oxidase subunit 2